MSMDRSGLGLCPTHDQSNPTKLGGGSLNPLLIGEGVRSEQSDSRRIAVGLVETINGGESKPK